MRFDAIDNLPDPTGAALAHARAEAGAGVVYFVQMGDDGPIKIGYTQRDKIKARLSVLQTGSPYGLHLRRLITATRETEAAAHRFFSDLRIRGEWFCPDPDLLAVAEGPWA